MPKIILDVKENILKEAKNELIEKGYTDFTIREVAKRCQISVGTFYNYFQNKQYVVAAIMAIDWKNELEKLNNKLESIASFNEGLVAIYESIMAYEDKYRFVFNAASESEAEEYYFKYHNMFQSQVSGMILKCIQRMNLEYDASMLIVAVELLILGANRKDLPFNDIEKGVNKLLKKDAN